MEAKELKIEKDFILSDSSVNRFGFKLKTEGWQPDEFKKLPLGFFNHTNKQDGALVKWSDIRVEGDKILGKPIINMSHPRGQRTVDEINSGYIATASLSGLIIHEVTTEPNPQKGGKPIPVVTKWANKECDLVTLPGNRGVIAGNPQLYDANENEIQLSDLLNTDHSNKLQMIPKEILQALSLSDGADAVAALVAITELSDKAGKYDAAKTELDALKNKTVKDEVEALCAKGLADKKLTVALSDSLKNDYADNPTGLKALIEAMPAHQSIVANLQQTGDKNSKFYKELSDMSLDDMMEKELAERCKEEFPDLFEKAFDEARGKGEYQKIYGGK